MEKLKAEADRLGKSSFAFAFYMDRQKEERERGVTISCTTKEFFTEKWHYTIIDAPGECPPQRDGLPCALLLLPPNLLLHGLACANAAPCLKTAGGATAPASWAWLYPHCRVLC